MAKFLKQPLQLNDILYNIITGKNDNRTAIRKLLKIYYERSYLFWDHLRYLLREMYVVQSSLQTLDTSTNRQFTHYYFMSLSV